MLAGVFLAVRYVLDRLSGPRSRAEELLKLRRRLIDADGPGVASRAEKGLALCLRELRRELATKLGSVHACARCVRPPSTNWQGGECCSAETRDLFNDHELAALRLAGTTLARLKPARGAHRGCAFRGASGCSLEVEDRPSVCVGYACRELLIELSRRGDGTTIARLQDELQAVFQRFVAERTTRMQKVLYGELEAGLLGHAGRRTRAK